MHHIFLGTKVRDVKVRLSFPGELEVVIKT